MADDEMAIMEEGGMEDEAPEADDGAKETSPAEGDEEETVAEEEAADEERVGDENGDGEGGEEEVLGEEAVGDEELGIRDEDQGRPVTALRFPSDSNNLVKILFCSQKSVTFAEPPASTGDTHQGMLTRMIRGMWASREMLHENSDKQLFMKTTLRELVIYCVFLFVIVYMTFGQYSSDFYLLRFISLVFFPDACVQCTWSSIYGRVLISKGPLCLCQLCIAAGPGSTSCLKSRQR